MPGEEVEVTKNISLNDNVNAATGAVRKTALAGFLKYLSGGGQFVIIGLLLLLFAFFLLDRGGTNTVLIFVLVVLGSAVFLFGTGTTGTGSLNNGIENSKITASIAGGAGLMSLLIGYGMVLYEPNIKQVFSGYQNGLLVMIGRSDKSNLNISDMDAIFKNNSGEILFFKRVDDEFMVVLPFNGRPEDINKELKVFLTHKQGIQLEEPALRIVLPNDLKLTLPHSNNQFFVSAAKLYLDLKQLAKQSPEVLAAVEASQDNNTQAVKPSISIPAESSFQ